MNGFSPFRHLKLRLWRLQAFLTILVATIAVLPPSIFFVLEVEHLRGHVKDQATQIAALTRTLGEEKSADEQALQAVLTQKIELTAVASIRFLEDKGKEFLQIGDAAPFFLPIEVTFPLVPPVGSLTELRLLADDRPLLYESLRVVTIHFLVAAVLGFVIYQIGARPLREAVDELENVQEQLIHSEKLSAIGEIYAGIAHEINNPLSIILARVDLLAETAKERRISADFHRDLEMIHRHGSRISEFIKGLLAFARKTPIDMRATDVNLVINEAVSLLEKPFRKHQIRFENLLSEDLPPIVGSSVHLQQVFISLLNNARDAMPEGGTITVRTYLRNGDVVAEVQDLGRGIGEEIKGKIFEPFFTTKGVGQGTGLGLTVTREIIKAHGGIIEVESLSGKGSVFRVSLPVDGGKHEVSQR